MNNTCGAAVDVDKLTSAKRSELLMEIENSVRYAIAHVDICGALAMMCILLEHQSDVITHLAAEIHVESFIIRPKASIDAEIICIYILLAAVRNYCSELEETYR
ncbi:GDP-mannose 4,6-dehydratase [Yersinia sp. 1252 StPb PI]|uniref:GDP-mannose 4,6-dehydratase n=1 Tax=Yersinia sp. 1252 StPb PI TaxID=3117404 RepID=UPI003B28B14E